MQALEADRQDDLVRRTNELLDGEVSNADAAKLMAVAASVSRDRRRMFALDEPDPNSLTVPPDEPDEETAEWVAAQEAEAELDLDRVRNGHDA